MRAVFAYAREPGKGSEPGAGWVWSRMLARMGEVWVITRESNRDLIQAAFGSIPEECALHFECVDLPPRARSWKRGASCASDRCVATVRGGRSGGAPVNREPRMSANPPTIRPRRWNTQASDLTPDAGMRRRLGRVMIGL
jgi:hypothetical protein